MSLVLLWDQEPDEVTITQLAIDEVSNNGKQRRQNEPTSTSLTPPPEHLRTTSLTTSTVLGTSQQIIIVQAFVRRIMSASILNLRQWHMHNNNQAQCKYKHVLANILRSLFVARMPSEEARSPGRRSNVENAPSHPPVSGQQRAQTPPSRLFALCRHIAGWTQACN